MTHNVSRLTPRTFPFVRMTTASARLELSSSHYLRVNGTLAIAGEAKIGDYVDVVSGSEDRAEAILAIETVSKAGLYNPHTIDGHILVNGIKAS